MLKDGAWAALFAEASEQDERPCASSCDATVASINGSMRRPRLSDDDTHKMEVTVLDTIRGSLRMSVFRKIRHSWKLVSTLWQGASWQADCESRPVST